MSLRKNLLIILIIPALLLSLSTIAPAYASEQSHFNIQLTGGGQVPPVTTNAHGSAHVQLIHNSMALRFSVEVCNIQNVTVSHIHVGAKDANGPPILFLYHTQTPLFSTSDCDQLSSGILTSSDLIPRPANGINNWNDFLNALSTGNTYINVHTTANPGGEIRGQLVNRETAHTGTGTAIRTSFTVLNNMTHNGRTITIVKDTFNLTGILTGIFSGREIDMANTQTGSFTIRGFGTFTGIANGQTGTLRLAYHGSVHNMVLSGTFTVGHGTGNLDNFQGHGTFTSTPTGNVNYTLTWHLNNSDDQD